MERGHNGDEDGEGREYNKLHDWGVGGWWFLRGGRGEEGGQSRGFYMEQEKVGHSLPFDNAWNDVFGLRIVKNERAVTT